MAIETETRLAGPYTGDGSQTVFSFAFKVFQSSDVQVWTSSDGINESVLPSTSYSVTLNSSQETNPGGSVTLNSALTSGYKLSITSAVAYLQPMVLTNQGGFYPEVLNTTADRQTILAQQLKTKIDRAIRVPLTSSESAESLLSEIINAKNTAITKASEAASSATSAAESATEAATAVEGFDDHVDDKKDEIDAYVVTKKSAIDTYVLAKETAFDSHVTDKTTAFDSNATSKTTTFDSHVTTKTTAFDAHAAEKQAAVDASAQAAIESASAAASSASDASDSATAAASSATEASTAVSGFDSHVEEKKTEFNTNATSKTNTFNSNATAKTSAFDYNATSKTSAFDSNATTKTTAFDSNATSKTTAFNTNYTEKKAVIDAGVVEAQGYAADAKKWAIGDPSEPAGSHSAKWFAEHMALNFKGEYSATTTYDVNQFVSNTSTSTTDFYISIVNGNVGNPLSDTTKWLLLFSITSGGTVAWGSITGSLSNQSDLATALATVLPSQSGMANKFLMTDGTDASWETVNSLPEQSQSTANKFLKSTGTAGSETWDTVDALPSQTGHANQFLKTDGTTASWSDVGDAFFTQIETISTVSVDPQSYTLSAFDKVHVYIDGILATENVSYTVSTYTVTFTSVLPVGTEAKFIGFKKLPLSSIPVASASQLGLVKVGSGLAIDGNGVLSSTPASAVLSSSVTLASNTVYSGTSVSTLEIAFPASYDDTFASQVNMTTGASVTFTGTGITMKGDDCADGTFTPSASTSYSIMFGSVNSAKLGVVMKV